VNIKEDTRRILESTEGGALVDPEEDPDASSGILMSRYLHKQLLVHGTESFKQVEVVD
jgi:hypothetical protein